MKLQNKKTVISDDKIIILDYLNYFSSKFSLLIVLLFFGPLLKQVINIGNLTSILIVAIIFILVISFTLYERFKKKKTNVEEGYEYIIDKVSRTLIVKKTEYFSPKKYEYSLENLKLKITDNLDSEEEKPYYNLYISIDGKEFLIQQAYDENSIKKLVDEIIRLINIPDVIIEDPKDILFNKTESLSKKDIFGGHAIDQNEVSEDEGSKYRHSAENNLYGGEGPDDRIKIKKLSEKIKELHIKDKGSSIPLLEPDYKVKVCDNKLIINVRRNYILFFVVLTLFLFLIYRVYLTESTITLERESTNEVTCEIKYNLLGIEKFETKKFVLKNLADITVESDSEGDITYIFEYDDNKKFSLALYDINSEDIEAIKSFLRDEYNKKLIIKGKQHFSSILFACLLVILAFILIVSSIVILLKIKIQKIVIDGDSRKIFLTFKSIIKKEEQEFTLSILKNIKIKKICDKDYLFMEILNMSLNLGQLKNKDKVYDIEMFAGKLFS